LYLAGAGPAGQLRGPPPGRRCLGSRLGPGARYWQLLGRLAGPGSTGGGAYTGQTP